MKLLDIIEEQVSSNVANKVYGQVVNAVSGIGTNLTEFLSAINSLRNNADFQVFSSLFKDKKTGYSSFVEMVNGEFDRWDYSTIQKLRKKLLSIGVDTTFKYGENVTGTSFFSGQFRIVPMSKVKPCNSFDKHLPRAIKYWKDWLSSPITKQKFKENWGYNPFKDVDSIFEQYLEALNGIRIEYYNKRTSTYGHSAYAYVNKMNPSKIFVNCDVRDPEPLDTLVHEIQHTLYNIQPLNPEKKIGSLFVDEKTKKETITDFFIDLAFSTVTPSYTIAKNVITNVKDKMSPAEDKSIKIDYNMVSKTTGIEPDTLKWWRNQALEKNKGKEGYVCRETEKMSNIMAIRKYFRLRPGQRITYMMLKNEMDKNRPHTDVYWLMSCWALNGFKDINGLLTKMNDLAYQETGSNNTSNLA
jgi:hypothetical protein